MKSIAAVTVLTLALACGGCATNAAQPLTGAGQVKQVITCGVKPDADPAAVLAAAGELAKLPEVRDVSAGYASKVTNAATTSPGETVTIILSFRNEAALAATIGNAEYVRIRDRQLRPLCDDVSFAQTTLQNYQVAEKYAEETEAATLRRRAAAIEQQNELRSRTK